MSKYKVINLFDKIFISVSVFLIIYSWINFFIRNLWTTFLLTLIFCSSLLFLLFYFSNKHKLKKINHKKYLKDIEEKFLTFLLLSKNEKLGLLKSIIEINNDCKKINNTLIFEKDNQKQQIIIATDCEKLTQFELVKALSLRQKSIEKLIVICCDFDSNLNTKFLKNLEIKIVNKKSLYDDYFCKQKSFESLQDLNSKSERKKFKEIIKNLFIPSKAKSYFLCGLILIFSSIILPYHFYYLIFGSTLLIFSIVCKLQPLFKH